MVISGVELVFLAFIFIFALGFLMPLLGARNSISIVKKEGGQRYTPGQRLSKQVRTADGECFYSQLAFLKCASLIACLILDLFCSLKSELTLSKLV